MTFQNGGINTLLEMLTYRRPGGSTTEEEFIERFIQPVDPYEDAFGNLMVQVGDHPKILWSSHTDTVHRNAGRQKVNVEKGIAKVEWVKGRLDNPNCLGADCGTGVWMMLEMIEQQIPGLYIFHREEESGGQGSSFIAKNTPDILSGIEFAIAFDRKGYDSVITHQGMRTASDDFAEQVAKKLGGKFKPDSTGVFTDTANYTDLIDECTNLSVGYFSQHGPAESQDLLFLQSLRNKIIDTDWSDLVAHRKAGEVDPDDRSWGWYGKRAYGSPTAPTTVEEFVRDFPLTTSKFLEQEFGVKLSDLQEFKDLLYSLKQH